MTVALVTRLLTEWHVTAVDPQAEMIEKAKSLHSSYENFSFEVGDNATFPHVGEDKYDLVLFNFVISWIESGRDETLQRLYNSTKRGGMLIFAYPCLETFDASCNAFHQWLTEVVSPEQMERFESITQKQDLVPAVMERKCADAGYTILSSSKKSIWTRDRSTEDMVKYLFLGTNKIIDLRPCLEEIKKNKPPSSNGEIDREIVYGVIVARK